MPSASFDARRGELEDYFDRKAVDAWARLTSDAPVGRIRATVRAGRDEMRGQLLQWLPPDLTGTTLLDAGCGTGALATAAATRGALVTAVDVSPKLVGMARERAQRQVDFHVGDMLDPRFGEFDHVVLMDSLIHYRASDLALALGRLAPRARRSILFTFAPRTPALAAMHAVGRIFPRADRAPAVEPVAEGDLRRRLAAEPALAGWRIGRQRRVSRGFYISQACELVRG